MPTSYGALCSGFTASQKLLVSMALPSDRDPVLGLFERVRKQRPALARFKRYSNELALESGPPSGGAARNEDSLGGDSEEWVAMRKRSVRSGCVNPSSMKSAKDLHRLVLETSPFYLGINPLEVEHLEVCFAFEMEASGNHNRIVADALLGDGPLAKFIEQEMDEHGAQPLDIQPFLGLAFGKDLDTEAYLELRTKTGPSGADHGRGGAGGGGFDDAFSAEGGVEFDPSGNDEDEADADEPITVYLTVRRLGPPTSVDDLPGWLDELWAKAERLTNDRVAPLILKPLRRAIASGRV